MKTKGPSEQSSTPPVRRATGGPLEMRTASPQTQKSSEQKPPHILLQKYLGIFLVGLAALGVLLPVLPTTPFLLLAARCFSKSSNRWHDWLMRNKTFGSLIRNWEERQCISRRTKLVATSSVCLVGTYTVVFALVNTYAQVATAALLIYALVFICRLSVCED